MNTAVQKVNNSPRPATPVAQVSTILNDMKVKFEAALPAHIPADRFVRIAMSACMNPQIEEVAATPEGRKSIYDSCLKAATDGLLVDGREAALVKFKTKIKNGNTEKWVAAAKYMPMVAGIMKKARNSGEIAAIFCQCVYSKDEFVIDYVTDGAPIIHRPQLGERGDFIGVYAVARLKDGSWTQPEVMDQNQVNKIRESSNSKDRGPWVDHWEEMARKTVIKRAAKYWPSSTDKDEALLSLTRRDDDEYLEHEEQPQISERKTQSAAAILTADEDTPYNEDGEIIEAQVLEDADI